MSRPKARALALIALSSALFSCSLVSLESMDIAIEPGCEAELAAPEGPIRLSFSIEPVHSEAESAFKLSSVAGSSTGDFRWTGSELAFYPVPPLKKGYRWTLSVSGKIRALDGRSFDVDESVSFYAGSSSPLLTLESFTPASGANVSTSEAIVLSFSRSVDQSTLRPNFNLSPSTEYDVSWSADGTTATVAPKAAWAALSTYAWRINLDLADPNGVGMARAYEGAFVVQAEGIAPFLSSARPALYAKGLLSPLEADLDQLGYLDAIYLSFNEEVTLSSVSEAFGLSPSLQGRVLRDGPSSFAFVPEEGFASRTKYKLTLSASVLDLAGNAMSEDYVTWFTPRVADLALIGADVTDAGGLPTAISFSGDSRAYGFTPTASDGSTTIAIIFNASIRGGAERERLVTLISCESLFPVALSPSLKSLQWAGDSRLELTYAGFQASSSAKTYYYKFLVPGGQSGVSDGAGGTMEKDAWLVMFTE